MRDMLGVGSGKGRAIDRGDHVLSAPRDSRQNAAHEVEQADCR